MTNLFRIRDLDLTDTEGLPAFINFCQDHDVNFYIKAEGPNGFPTCTLISNHRSALMEVLMKWCAIFDQSAHFDMIEMV